MLLKPLSCYLCGVGTTALTLSLAGGRLALAAFVLGAIVAILCALRFPKLLLPVLIRAGQPATRAYKVRQASVQSRCKVGDTSVESRSAGKPQISMLTRQVESALKNLGTDRAIAREAAAAAAQQLPNAQFEDAFRFALNHLRG